MCVASAGFQRAVSAEDDRQGTESRQNYGGFFTIVGRHDRLPGGHFVSNLRCSGNEFSAENQARPGFAKLPLRQSLNRPSTFRQFFVNAESLSPEMLSEREIQGGTICRD
jgi:hypothetical protein